MSQLPTLEAGQRLWNRHDNIFGNLIEFCHITCVVKWDNISTPHPEHARDVIVWRQFEIDRTRIEELEKQVTGLTGSTNLPANWKGSLGPIPIEIRPISFNPKTPMFPPLDGMRVNEAVKSIINLAVPKCPSCGEFMEIDRGKLAEHHANPLKDDIIWFVCRNGCVETPKEDIMP